MADRIETVAVVTVRAPLPVTIRFGPWVMEHREFALCRVRTEEGAGQVEALLEAGWRRFKQPIAATPEETRARLRAARAAMGPDCWLGMDCNWVFKSAGDAVDFARSIEDVDLGWIEDIVPPGN